MAISFVRNIISSGYNLDKLNENFEKIATALQDAVSRSGSTPNQMNVDLDMNSNDLINVGEVQAQGLILGGQVVVPGSELLVLPPSVMTKPVYDPQAIGGDAFDLNNHTGTIGNTQLENGAVSDVKLDPDSGVYNRVVDVVSPFDPAYGAVGGVADDNIPIQAAWDAGAAGKATVIMPRALRSGFELKTDDDLHVKWNTGAWTKMTDVSVTGSFITNLRNNNSAAASIQSNMWFENPMIDGSEYPAVIVGDAQAGGVNTITLEPGSSAVDDFYNGLRIVILDGTGTDQVRVINNYVGATKVATVSANWGTPPDATSVYQIGYNDNAFGFAAGASNIRITGGYIKNFPHLAMTAVPTGAKGVNFEQGVNNGLVDGTFFENMGAAVFCQGLDGSSPNGASNGTTRIQFKNISAVNCGSLATFLGIVAGADPDGDPRDQMVVFDGGTYENCGFAPYRIVGTDLQKSGVINFGECQNISINNIRGRNDPTYPQTSPGWPTDYPGRVGYSLGGSIGAMIWGWGRNLKINNFVHHGDVDNIITIRRARAIGDDAGSGAFPGAPQNCFDWDFQGIKHYGVINEYIIRIDPTPGFRVVNAELTGRIDVSVNGAFVTLGLVDPAMSGFTAITLTIHDHTGGKTIIGTPQQIFAAGNTFASFGTGVTDLRKVDRELNSISIIKTATIADDAVFTWTVPTGATAVELVLHSTATSARGLLTWNGSVWSVISQPVAALVEVSTSVLTGTTGTDARLTVSKNGNTIYIENRLGASYALYAIPKYYG